MIWHRWTFFSVLLKLIRVLNWRSFFDFFQVMWKSMFSKIIRNLFLNWRMKLSVSLVRYSLDYIKMSLKVFMKEWMTGDHSVDFIVSYIMLYIDFPVINKKFSKMNSIYVIYLFLKKPHNLKRPLYLYIKIGRLSQMFIIFLWNFSIISYSTISLGIIQHFRWTCTTADFLEIIDSFS